MQSAVLRHVRHSAAAAAGFDDDKSQGRDSGVAVTLDDSMAVSTSSSENCFDDDDDEGGGGGGVMEGGSRDAGDDNEEFRREMKKLRPSGWTVFKTFAIGILGIPGAVLRLRTRPDHNPLAARPLTGRKLFHWLDPISMERLKGLQSRLGGGFTINDIISTATSRALWRYMFNHCPMEVGPERVDDDLEAQRSLCTEGQSPDQAPRSKETRNWLLSDAATVAFWTKFPDKFKNRFGLCRLRSRPPRILTGDAHFAQAAAAAAAAASGDGDYSAALRRSALADLVARRREIRRFLKDRNLGFAQYAAANMAPQCLPVWMADLLMRPPHRGVTYVTSNVKGPPSKIMVQGVNVDRIFAFPPQLGTSGISVMTFGYEKDLLMSIIADTGYLPTAGDVALLGKYVVDEIAVLEDAATFESPSLLRRNETVVLDIETV